MPPALWNESAAYKAYSALRFRPDNVPTWPKNKHGKFLVEPGELMCRIEVNGAICPTDTCFKSSSDLTKHIKDFHGTDTVQKQKRGGHGRKLPAGMSKDEFLIDFYTKLVADMRRASQSDNDDCAMEHQADAVSAEITPINSYNADDSETEDEDQVDDDGDAPPAVPSMQTSSAITSYGITEYPSNHNFLNPKPPSPSPPSLLPALCKRKFDLHADWDPKVLKRVKADDAKVLRRATDESMDMSLGEKMWKAREEARKRNRY